MRAGVHISNFKGFYARGGRAGNALFMVMVLAFVAFAVLVGVLSWARTSTDMSGRNNQYNRSLVAAEAATEKVIAHIGNDYQNSGVALVGANLDIYRKMVPDASEIGNWTDYEFQDEGGAANRTTVEWLPLTEAPILSQKYKGLRGFAYDVRIVSKARELGSPYNIVSRNEQNLELALIPVFQYAIFYNEDLEINPGPAMNVTGPVHCNANIYCDPNISLDFWDQVTAAGEISLEKKPGDPLNRRKGVTRFNGGKTPRFQSLNLPLGTTNTAEAARQILEIPPAGEARGSLLGQLRYYNKADLVILVTSTGVKITSGSINGFGTTVDPTQGDKFVKITGTFRDGREGKTVQCTDIDIGALRTWCTNATSVVQNVRTVYVGDLRPPSSSTTMSAVRLTNGHWLPPKGLTVATFNPLYVKGHYNVCASNNVPVNLGSSNTTFSLPASFAADSITFLSSAWTDNRGTTVGRAVDTTVNAAILAGHSGTLPNVYGGGVENFPRFLEDWNNVVFTLNTSMVSMFQSQIATGKWGGSYYVPPTRNWAFDKNFNDPAKLPPSTPQIRVMLRGQWWD